jgi:hypothetical protein
VRKGSKKIRHLRDAWLYGTPRWVLAQTRQEACDRLETTVMRPSETRENKQTNKHKIVIEIPPYYIDTLSATIHMLGRGIEDLLLLFATAPVLFLEMTFLNIMFQ